MSGAGIPSRESSEFWYVTVGVLVSLTATLFPFVGWFLILPLLLAAEFGTGFRSLLRQPALDVLAQRR